MRYFTLLLLLAAAGLSAENPVIRISTPLKPPAWAHMERALLKENARLMEVFARKYVNPHNGYLEVVEHWGGADGPDDAMENFFNWPLVYVLGGEESTLDLFRLVWEGHLRQYTKLGMYHKEFITAFDWEHTGEGMEPFFLLPLADPDDAKNRERALRFANFYTGRDPSVQNYDPQHKIIRSILNGSRGARLEATPEYWGDRPGHDYFRKSGDWTQVKGDVPMNFGATSLAVNAYILTGDRHYRDWVLEYMGAWRERAIANKGWVPSIVGLNGQVGEGWQGKWYGGLMGWNWTFGGWGILGRGVRTGFLNAAFLGGPDYLDVLRQQGQRLLETRVKTPRGMAFLNKYGDQGPHGPSGGPLFEGLYSDIYLQSLEKRDLEALRAAANPAPSERRSVPVWNFENEAGRYEGGNEASWIDYLEGNDPGYPERALGDAFSRIRYYVQAIREDKSTPDTRQADTPHIIRASKEAPLSAVGAVTGALVNLTLGGPQPLWAGGLLFSEVRYFDPARRRPGLPEDVAALITRVAPDQVKVTLVNLNQTAARTVTVQTGAYGEHTCERVASGSGTLAVNGRWFEVELDPGAGGELTIYRKKFSAQPAFRFPWQGARP
ncbi:MAG: hypothetical protein IT158_23370 [Bryobacterales bacterium]|nr:hypothetical protein [Bryobacterales bacterium]